MSFFHAKRPFIFPYSADPEIRRKEVQHNLQGGLLDERFPRRWYDWKVSTPGPGRNPGFVRSIRNPLILNGLRLSRLQIYGYNFNGGLHTFAASFSNENAYLAASAHVERELGQPEPRNVPEWSLWICGKVEVHMSITDFRDVNGYSLSINLKDHRPPIA